jgi:hypothetical protein
MLHGTVCRRLFAAADNEDRSDIACKAEQIHQKLAEQFQTASYDHNLAGHTLAETQWRDPLSSANETPTKNPENASCRWGDAMHSKFDPQNQMKYI